MEMQTNQKFSKLTSIIVAHIKLIDEGSRKQVQERLAKKKFNKEMKKLIRTAKKSIRIDIIYISLKIFRQIC